MTPIQSVVVTLCMLACAPLVNGSVPLSVHWNHVTQQEKGVLISPDDISYTTYRIEVESGEMTPLCTNNPQNKCDAFVQFDECYFVGVTAMQPSTGLTSIMSNTLEVCGGPKPEEGDSPPLPVEIYLQFGEGS